MIVYKVFQKNYELRKGELMGMLIERRKDLRERSKVESGLRWAKFAFGSMVKDKQSIFVVPDELKLGSDPRWFVEKGVLSKEDLFGMFKLSNQAVR